MNRKIIKFFTPLLITLIFIYFLDLKELYEQTLFYVFQERDLARARGILKGMHILFGPEMTGGGNLPGSLYYYLLAGALKIYNNWLSAWWLQIIITNLGIVYSFYHLKKYPNQTTSFLWIIAVSSAPLTYRFLQIFLNVSLLIPFCIIAILFINSAFSQIENKNRSRDLYIASFIIGLGLQFHYSIAILFITIIFLFIAPKKLNIHQFTPKQIIYSFCFYILPSIPYYIWSIGQKTNGELIVNSGSSFNAIGSLLYLIRFAFHSEIDGFLLESLRKALFTFPFFLFVFASAKFFNIFSKRKLELKTYISEYAPIYLCLVFSFIPYIDWYLSSQAVRYTMPFYLCLNLVSAIIFSKSLQDEKETSYLNYFQAAFILLFSIFLYKYYPSFIFSKFLLTSIIIITITILAIVLIPQKKVFFTSLALFTSTSYSQFITKDFYKLPDYHWALFMPQTYEWKHIWNVIETYTGWDYNQAKNKIYYIGHHLEQSPSLYLENHKFEAVNKIMNFNDQPDGFFISNRYRIQNSNALVLNKLNFSLFSPRQWMLRQNIQPDLFAAIKNKQIIVGKNLSNIIFIAPYWIKDHENLPDQIHNLGMGYILDSENELLELVKDNIGSKMIENNTIIFKANECTSHLKYCSNGAIVSFSPNTEKQTTIKIKILGNTISQTSPWITPDWTQAWFQPALEIECNNKTFNFEIVKSVGFFREGSHILTSPLLQAFNGFVAPISKTINLNCPASKIKRISLIRGDSKVESIKSTKALGKIKIDHLF